MKKSKPPLKHRIMVYLSRSYRKTYTAAVKARIKEADYQLGIAWERAKSIDYEDLAESKKESEEANSVCPKCKGREIVDKMIATGKEHSLAAVNRCKTCEMEWAKSSPWSRGSYEYLRHAAVSVVWTLMAYREHVVENGEHCFSAFLTSDKKPIHHWKEAAVAPVFSGLSIDTVLHYLRTHREYGFSQILDNWNIEVIRWLGLTDRIPGPDCVYFGEYERGDDDDC